MREGWEGAGKDEGGVGGAGRVEGGVHCDTAPRQSYARFERWGEGGGEGEVGERRGVLQLHIPVSVKIACVKRAVSLLETVSQTAQTSSSSSSSLISHVLPAHSGRRRAGS